MAADTIVLCLLIDHCHTSQSTHLSTIRTGIVSAQAQQATAAPVAPPKMSGSA